ncbi:MAG: carbonate dehydratase [Sphaerospermopsis sp. SIO1G2]|nr:carbonate dehydratase [Sphaerospermopsis sp. SIO1G2]
MKNSQHNHLFKDLGSVDRRSFLATIPLALMSARNFSFNFPSLTAAITKNNAHEWDYENREWGDISQDYQVCKMGKQQSPIDLNSTIKSELKPVEIHYQDIQLSVINNSHTIQVNNQLENFIILDDHKFDLLQFHFHHPSEHSVSGKNYPMEIHFVHKNEDGNLAVLAVFLQEGRENKTLQQIWDVMPSQKSLEKYFFDISISPFQLLPKESEIYRYFGSLTTPPCSEIVNWIVFKEPLEISSAQFQQFQNIFPNNARQTQPINRRSILTSI